MTREELKLKLKADLKAWRESKSFTQKQAAEFLNAPLVTYKTWESSKVDSSPVPRWVERLTQDARSSEPALQFLIIKLTCGGHWSAFQLVVAEQDPEFVVSEMNIFAVNQFIQLEHELVSAHKNREGAEKQLWRLHEAAQAAKQTR